MCALGIQARSRAVRVSRTITQFAEQKSTLLAGLALLCGVVSISVGYGLVRIGRWFVFRIKRKLSPEEQQASPIRRSPNYEWPSSESIPIVENVGQNRRDAELENRIRLRAYQLYEARGRFEGDDWQDWFNAEREIFGL
jgi:hypothetical protein